ncbi:hypothetical protein [Methylobacterium organophilum]|uniref:Bacteriocin n=1 Tax=Methylobacterium organophilum TaxID=410 RepID=A0ABQ4T459_METOR|nr:hypothetical protein [Methylobacterium organophilum]GJE25796.1 hypothetical protein LKMONMHP_0636 [Methylobacterium organophilum]
MTTKSAEQNAPVRLNDDELESVNGGAGSAFGDLNSMFNDIKRGIGNGATQVSYHQESQTVRGKTKTVTQSHFRR